MEQTQTFTECVATEQCINASNYLPGAARTGSNKDYTSKFECLISSKVYVAYTGSVFEHIVTNAELTNLEKIYYLLADSLALINSNSGKNRFIALPSEKWAARLNCSRSQIFSLQKSLVDKGYFVIIKQKNKIGQNERNLIIPTLPDKIFKVLCESAACKVGVSLYNPISENKRSYLDRTRLFIPINYQLLQNITASNNLNALQKIIWLDLFVRGAKLKRFSFSVSFTELAKRHSYSSNYISQLISDLQKNQFIRAGRFFVREGSNEQDRQDISLWKIDLTLPKYIFDVLAKSKNRASFSSETPAAIKEIDALSCCPDPHPLIPGSILNKVPKSKPFKNRSKKNSLSKKSQITKSESNFSKIKIKKGIERASKAIITTAKSAKEQETLPVINKIRSALSQSKELKDFYPLSEKDCLELQSASKRGFSLNAMNEILKDMAKRLGNEGLKSKKPPPKFDTKKRFLSYMSKAFAGELRSEYNTNNIDFRIRNNLSLEEKTVQQQEEYLDQIEHSQEVSPEWQFRKKIALLLKRETAYNLLIACRSINVKEGVFTLNLAKHVELTNQEREIILDQARKAHVSQDLKQGRPTHIERLEVKMPEREKVQANSSLKQPGQSREGGDKKPLPPGIWGRVRQSLIEFYRGESVDQDCFSKLTALVNEEKREVELLAPSRFIKHWIEQNFYIHNMEKAFLGYGYKLLKIGAPR